LIRKPIFVDTKACGQCAFKIRLPEGRYFHRPGQYFTANLAEAVFLISVPEAGILKINDLQ